MTKEEMAEALVRSPAWDGIKNASELCKRYSKEEIQDLYDELDVMEDRYNEFLYGDSPYFDGDR